MALAPAAYPITDTSTLAIEYARAKIRPYVDPANLPADGVNRAGWQDVGEVESFTQNVNTTPKEVWSKSLPVAQLILTVPTKLKSTCSMKVLNRTPLMRAYSMLGSTLPVNQAAGPVSYAVTAMIPGEVHYVGANNITGVTVALAGGGAVDPHNYTVVDQAAGGVLFNPNMDPAVAGQGGVISCNAPARTSYEIVAGGQPIVDIELALRGVSDVGQKGLLRILRWRINPKGDQPYISASDDISGFEFEGQALLVSRGGINTSAIWTPFDA